MEWAPSCTSAHPSAALQASKAIPCPCTLRSKIQPISGSRRDSGLMSRQTGRSRSGRPACRRTSARPPKVPIPMSCHLPTPPSKRRQLSSRFSEFGTDVAHELFGRRGCMHTRRGRPCANARRISRSVSIRGASRIKQAYFLPRVRPPKRLLKRATWPPVSSSFWLPPVQAGCTFGIDVEVKRVAFLAPGRTGLELGAVGHFDVDHVVIGVSTGLHVIFPWVSRWFPTSSDKLSGAFRGGAKKLQPTRGSGSLRLPCHLKLR